MQGTRWFPAALIGAALMSAAMAPATPAVVPPPTTTEKPRSDIDKVGDTLQGMGEKPLKDFNLMKEKIPPELLAIMARPYDLHGITGCTGYRREVARMTALIGPDVDAASSQNQKESATEVMLGGAASVVGGLIPGSGLIRKISGAEAQQKRAQAAVLAGALRRAYIKGLASGRKCKI